MLKTIKILILTINKPSLGSCEYSVRYFLKRFSQVASSQGSPSGNFPRVFFQVATYQMCNFPSGNFPKVRLGPLRRHRLQWGAERCSCDGLGDRAPRLGQTWEVVACHLGSCPLGKYPWKVATWEKYFGNNIV